MAQLMMVDEATGEITRRATTLEHAGDYAKIAQMMLTLSELEAAPATETAEEKAEREQSAANMEAMLRQALEATEEAIGAKVDGIGRLDLELAGREAGAEATRKEFAVYVQRMQRHRDALGKQRSRLREYLGDCLEEAGERRFDGKCHKAYFSGSPKTQVTVSIVPGMEEDAVALGYAERLMVPTYVVTTEQRDALARAWVAGELTPEVCAALEVSAVTKRPPVVLK
jgi:hypothetical protein